MAEKFITNAPADKKSCCPYLENGVKKYSPTAEETARNLQRLHPGSKYELRKAYNVDGKLITNMIAVWHVEIEEDRTDETG